METCKIRFEAEDGQQIILECSVDEKQILHQKIYFEPEITDPEKDLGLSAILLQRVLEAFGHRPPTKKASNLMI
ncbi:MAG: hypothetical protein KBT03_10325 [Bacteroidales bacterium]|nr:hypothetical protein [Candidatus Scybalousia scybalohippi]